MHEAVPRSNKPAQAFRRTDHVTRSRPPNRHKLREQLLALTHLYQRFGFGKIAEEQLQLA